MCPASARRRTCQSVSEQAPLKLPAFLNRPRRHQAFVSDPQSPKADSRVNRPSDQSVEYFAHRWRESRDEFVFMSGAFKRKTLEGRYLWQLKSRKTPH